MGQEVLKQIQNSEDFSILCGIDRSASAAYSFPIYTNIHDVKEHPDVIIDFSVPSASIEVLKFSVEHNIPIVIATTGFSDEELSTIKKYSEKVPIFRSGNMSYEVAVLSNIVAKLAVLLKDSDIEIVETHHNNKIDSPSGTALLLADSINNALGNVMTYEYNRQAKKEKRNSKEIGIHSVRGGTIVGKHTVSFFGENETLEITHNSDSRSVYAKGAIKAARFIVNQKNGLYDMKDLIK